VREEVRVSSSVEADDAVSILHVKVETHLVSLSARFIASSSNLAFHLTVSSIYV
jgi:hypothetical protein